MTKAAEEDIFIEQYINVNETNQLDYTDGE